MKIIIHIPLDERPCNYNFIQFLAKETDYKIITPPQSMLGDKKKPADIDELWCWLFENAKDADGAIIAMDMLLYGGIVPSRLHHYSIGECLKKISKLEELKKKFPKLIIYAFSLIMRCPNYSSSDEEPDYYEEFGEVIHKQLNIASNEECRKISIPESILYDFESRRDTNLRVNLAVIGLLKTQIIDFLIIPQDDSAPYGYTAIDQHEIRSYIKSNNLQLKAYMYPGADEVSCTLLARYINCDKRLRPLVNVRYSSVKAPFIIPLYEDRILGETIKYQLLAAGYLMSDSEINSDLHLFVNAPGSNIIEARKQGISSLVYDVERNLVEFIESVDYQVNNKNAKVIVADVAYGNGADLALINLIKQKKLLFSLAGYAGWNTSSNTLGTAIANGTVYNVFGKTRSHLEFLALRYIEDAGYCSNVRWDVSDNILKKAGLNYFKADGKNGKIAELVKNKLQDYSDTLFENENFKPVITKCCLPWNRMFEVDLKVEMSSPD